MQHEALGDELAQRVPQSGWQWMLSVLGFDLVFLLAAAALAFALVLVLLLRGKGPAMVGAVILIVPLPLFIALSIVLRGLVASGSVIAIGEVAPKPFEVFGGIAESALLLHIGLLHTVPSFLLATIGLIVRALQGEPLPTSTKPAN